MREYRYEWEELYLKCPKCWKWLSKSFFHKDKTTHFWVTSHCNDCRNTARNKYYWNNKDEENRKYREYRLANEEREKARYKEYRRTHREERIALNKEIAKKHNELLWFNWGSFHDRANRYVRKHNLRPKSCSICWKQCIPQMHHPYCSSYDDWSNVIFCCQSCHWLIHSWRILCPEPINLLNLPLSN